MKYWLVAKLVSWGLNWFAKRNDNEVTKDVAKFVGDVIDKAQPTDLKKLDAVVGVIKEVSDETR